MQASRTLLRSLAPNNCFSCCEAEGESSKGRQSPRRHSALLSVPYNTRPLDVGTVTSCYHHVQAILVAIDQYAEAATGNREFFLNKPARREARRHAVTAHSRSYAAAVILVF